MGDNGDLRFPHRLRFCQDGERLVDDRERFLWEYLSDLDLERDLNARGGVLPRSLGGVLDLPLRTGDGDGDLLLCDSLPAGRENSLCPTDDREEERERLSPSFPLTGPGLEDLCLRESGDFSLSGDAMRLIGGRSDALTRGGAATWSGDGGTSEELLSLEESELLSSEEESELLGFEEAGVLRIFFVPGEGASLDSSGCSCLIGSHSALGGVWDKTLLWHAEGGGELETFSCPSGDSR